MTKNPGSAVPKIGDWAVVICYDTIGNVVRAALVLETADHLGCGCTRYETTRPGPGSHSGERMTVRSGCTYHGSQLEAFNDGEQVIYKGGFLYPTDEDPPATDPVTLLELRKGDRITLDGSPHAYSVATVTRDEYGIYATVMVSTRTDVIDRAA